MNLDNQSEDDQSFQQFIQQNLKRKRESEEEKISKKVKVEPSFQLDETFIEEHFNCLICFELMYPSVVFNCGHTLTCLSCYNQAESKMNECPVCRSYIRSVSRNYQLDNLTSSFFPNHEKIQNPPKTGVIHPIGSVEALIQEFEIKNRQVRDRLADASHEAARRMVNDSIEYFDELGRNGSLRPNHQVRVRPYSRTGNSNVDLEFQRIMSQLGYQLDFNRRERIWLVTLV